MGNASSAGEEETVLAAQLASSSKDSYSTSQLSEFLINYLVRYSSEKLINAYFVYFKHSSEQLDN